MPKVEGVVNIFELLGEEGEERKNIQKVLASQKESAKEETPKDAVPAKKELSAGRQDRKEGSGNRSGRGDGNRASGPRNNGPRFENRRAGPAQGEGFIVGEEASGAKGSRGPRPPRDNKERKPREFRRDRDTVSGEIQTREPREGGARPPRNFDGEGRPPKRQYDRRPGTGRPINENKKGGAGKANWGTETDEVVAVETEKVVKEAEGEKVEAEVVPEAPTEEEIAKAKEEAEEAKQITLEEYLKQKQSKTPKIELPKARAAGEGVDQTLWQNYQKLSRDEEDAKEAEKKSEAEKKKPGKQIVTDLIKVRYNDDSKKGPRFENRERNGDRRGGRGGRSPVSPAAGRGAPQKRTEEKIIPLNDNSAFPTLGNAPAPVQA